MKVINLLVMIFLISINVMGQSQIDIIDKSVNPGETLTEIPMEPLATKGHYFLNDEWLVGNILLKNNQSIKNRFIKYDIENKHLEIKVDNEVKVLEIDRVKDFEMYDNGFIKKFTNSYSYKLADNSRLIGVFEVLAEGKIKLFVKQKLN